MFILFAQILGGMAAFYLLCGIIAIWEYCHATRMRVQQLDALWIAFLLGVGPFWLWDEVITPWWKDSKFGKFVADF
jgi:hypothetical protein